MGLAYGSAPRPLGCKNAVTVKVWQEVAHDLLAQCFCPKLYRHYCITELLIMGLINSNFLILGVLIMLMVVSVCGLILSITKARKDRKVFDKSRRY